MAGGQFHDLYPSGRWAEIQNATISCAKFYTCRGPFGEVLKYLEGRATHYFFAKNFPNPKRICTVFIPGFGDVSPAFEICM